MSRALNPRGVRPQQNLPQDIHGLTELEPDQALAKNLEENTRQLPSTAAAKQRGIAGV